MAPTALLEHSSAKRILTEEVFFEEPAELLILEINRLVRRDDLLSEKAVALSVHREVNRLVTEHGVAVGKAFEKAFKGIAGETGVSVAQVRSFYTTHLPFVATTVSRGKTSGGKK